MCCAQVVLADLAGSERLAKSASQGTALREALHINRCRDARPMLLSDPAWAMIQGGCLSSHIRWQLHGESRLPMPSAC